MLSFTPMRMGWQIAGYGVALALCALLLEWLDLRHASRALSRETYVLIVALLFAGIGIWVGIRLTPARTEGPFEPNEAAIRQLGISPREREVLALLAAGHSNKEIARLLAISPNTVKTHVAALIAKLEASRRTQAIERARSLAILP